MRGETIAFAIVAVILCPFFILASISPIRNVISCLYGPFLPGPGGTHYHGIKEKLHSILDLIHVTSKMLSIYLSLGILTALCGTSVMGIGIGQGIQSPHYETLLFLMALGIASISLIRIFSVLQSTGFLIWLTFFIIGIIGAYLPAGTIVFGAEFPKFLTDRVFQHGAQLGLERMSNVIDKLVIPGVLMSLVAVVITETAIKIVTNRGLTAVPVALFEEYRQTFLLHEQRFSRKQVTALYLARLKDFERKLDRGKSNQQTIRWVTHSATQEIIRKLIELHRKHRNLQISIVAEKDAYQKLHEALNAQNVPVQFEETEKTNSEKERNDQLQEGVCAIRVKRIPNGVLPCPRFMVIEDREVIAAMPIPPRNLNKPTVDSSNIAFRSTLPDCVSRFKRIFDHLFAEE